ncbi:hypothetical protein HJFPF1_00870 [Paramyrothecium foliicola]|nr:hypothetical protein HJFPF1_00870 [Paramyrothecium foliicola]
MAAEQPPRPHTADPTSHYSFLGTRRSFPLVGRKKTKTSGSLNRPSTSHSTSSAPSTGLRIRLFLRFSSPLNTEHHAEFQSSPSFGPSDQVCQALLRRLQHCSAELITRRDCTAMDPPQATPQSAAARPMRFQMTFCIDRHGLRWAEETFTSYQHEPLTPDLADDVLEEARLSVSSFLSRHDPGFRCAEAGSAAVRPETSRPCFGLPQPAACIPRDVDIHQPGYFIELFLRGRGPDLQKNTSVRLESLQSSPLTLLLGEDVLSRASKSLDRAFEQRKAQFEELHQSCDGLEGTGGCDHVLDGAFDALVKIRNNLGPDYTHLSHRLQSCRIIFSRDDSPSFGDFAAYLKEQLEAVRDQADRSLVGVDDLAFNLRKLRIQDQLFPNPLCISLDASVTYDRRKTNTLLARVQAGIRHVVQGTGASLVLTAHKRGHLVLDTIIQDVQESTEPTPGTPSLTVDNLLTMLKDRMRADIVMICKDTCSIECTDLLQNLKIHDARTASGDDRPSTSGPMLPAEPPVTPTRQSLSKRRAESNLRQVSLSASRNRTFNLNESIQSEGYMVAAPSDDAYLTDDSSTPSLVDTDSISPHDSVLITPESSRVTSREPPTFGIRLIDDELADTPISTQDIGLPNDDEHTVYGRPPFQSHLATSKTPSNLSVAMSPNEANTTFISNSEPVPAQPAVTTPLHELPADMEPIREASNNAKYEQPAVATLLHELPASVEPTKEALDNPKNDDLADEPAKTSPEDVNLLPQSSNLAVKSMHSQPAPDISTLPEPLPEPTVLDSLPSNGNSSSSTVVLVTELGETCSLTPTVERGSIASPPEKGVDASSQSTDYFSIDQDTARPSASVITERSRSSALILRTRPESFHINSCTEKGLAAGDLDSNSHRRWSNPRPSFRHRRQFSSPTAGYLGLHGEYLVEMGLMNAVIPSHFRTSKP